MGPVRRVQAMGAIGNPTRVVRAGPLGGQIARAAGTYVQVVGRDRGMVIVRLNSGEQRYVRSDCMLRELANKGLIPGVVKSSW